MDGAINSVFRQDIMGKSPLVLCSLLSKWCSFASFFHVKILPFDLDVLLQLLLIWKEM